MHRQVTIHGSRANDGGTFVITCDEGIADVVKGLNERGAKTVYSCEATGSNKTPYIAFRVSSKKILAECIRYLEKQYADKYSIVICATKRGCVNAYCTTRDDVLRSWFSCLSPVSEMITIIPKNDEGGLL